MGNFADDNTSYDFGKTTDEVIDKLEKQSDEWYKYDYLRPNPEKWHLILNEKE